jgi:hypothetical protein
MVLAALVLAAIVEVVLLHQVAFHPAGGGGEPRDALVYLLSWASIPIIGAILLTLVAAAISVPIVLIKRTMLFCAAIGAVSCVVALAQYSDATPGFLLIGFLLQCGAVFRVLYLLAAKKRNPAK